MSEPLDSHSVHADILLNRAEAFTAREKQVITLLAAGYPTPAVARKLGIAPRTVKSYTDRLKLMLGVETLRGIPLAYMRATGDDPFPRPGGEEAA